MASQTHLIWSTTKLSFTGVLVEMAPLSFSLFQPHIPHIPSQDPITSFALFLPVLMIGNEMVFCRLIGSSLALPAVFENWVYSLLENQCSPSLLLHLFPDFSEGFLEVLLPRFLTVREQPILLLCAFTWHRDHLWMGSNAGPNILLFKKLWKSNFFICRDSKSWVFWCWRFAKLC